MGQDWERLLFSRAYLVTKSDVLSFTDGQTMPFFFDSIECVNQSSHKEFC